jgi:hypothetical protein
MTIRAVPSPSRRAVIASSAVALLVLGADAAAAPPAPVTPPPSETHLPARGAPAPPIVMPTVDGGRLDTNDLRGQVVVVLFGATSHERTRQAATAVHHALGDPRLQESAPRWILVLSRGSVPERLADELPAAPPRPRVVHDVERSVYGAYGVVVQPSTVVIDREGRVVHAMPGLGPRYDDVVLDAVLFAAGEISSERFAATLDPESAGPDAERRTRAERIARLAVRLRRRGLDEMAEAEFRAALEVDPNTAIARIGLGDLLLEREALDEAEAQYRAALAVRPRSLEATLGLAAVYVHRGGSGLVEGEALIRRVIERSPRRARAHYLLGMVLESQGDPGGAAASYRRAAELLLPLEYGSGVGEEVVGEGGER